MDEKQARHLLAEMQARLARSSYDALELPAGTVSTEQIRSAFFQLTKTFHPLKFAQMAPDIQKLANEVFLALRAAHDSLARPAKQRLTTGGFPALQRPPTPAPATPPSSSAPATPPSSSAPATAANRPSGPNVMPRPAAASTSSTRLPTTPMPRLTPPLGVPTQVDLTGIEDLLNKQQWDAARKQLTALIAKDPRPRYKALLQYSFGREAQLARKTDEARDKLLDALEIDSELLIAQKALAELHTRRK